jgi:hypothetical protein
MSWEAADQTCAKGLLQMAKLEKITTTNCTDHLQQNMSYWLGIYKNNTCKMHLVKDLVNVTQVKLKKCPYVENFTNASLGDCNEMNHAICVKPGEMTVLSYFPLENSGHINFEHFWLGGISRK